MAQLLACIVFHLFHFLSSSSLFASQTTTPAGKLVLLSEHHRNPIEFLYCRYPPICSKSIIRTPSAMWLMFIMVDPFKIITYPLLFLNVWQCLTFKFYRRQARMTSCLTISDKQHIVVIMFFFNLSHSHCTRFMLWAFPHTCCPFSGWTTPPSNSDNSDHQSGNCDDKNFFAKAMSITGAHSK